MRRNGAASGDELETLNCRSPNSRPGAVATELTGVEVSTNNDVGAPASVSTEALSSSPILSTLRSPPVAGRSTCQLVGSGVAVGGTVGTGVGSGVAVGKAR